ncbi:alkyl hydroperoxide reductase subunit AhpF [Sphingomonas zeicaulis]
MAVNEDWRSDLERWLEPFLAGLSHPARRRMGVLSVSPVDPHQRTSVAGLYAAGDVVLGLDQLSHAMGEGGVAATTIRNDLAQRSPLLR